MSPAEPIFVHSSFRVSSTWFWIKLREAPQVTAYYEIFHERLAQLTAETVMTFNTECWESRHPRTSPYFMEYLPLLASPCGVRGYHQRMAFWEFIPQSGLNGAVSDGIQVYVASLIKHADAIGTIPVLTCSRSIGRIGGLRRAFGGRHILLVRGFLHQWLSYASLTAEGVYYFINATLATISNGRSDPFLAWLFSQCIQEEPTRQKGSVILRFVNERAFLRAFLGLHIYLYLAAYDCVDLVVDASQLAANSSEIARTADAINKLTGLALNLGDIQDIPAKVNTISTEQAKVVCRGLIQMAITVLNISPERDSVKFAKSMVTNFIKDCVEET